MADLNQIKASDSILGQLYFKSPAYFSGRLIFFLSFFTVGAFFAIIFILRNTNGNLNVGSFLFLLVGAALIILLMLLLRYLSWLKIIPPLQFTREALLIPQHSQSKKMIAIFYDDLKSLDVRGSDNLRDLVIGSSNKTFVFPLRHFQHTPDEVERIINSSLLKVPDGADLLLVLHEKQASTRQLMTSTPRVTYILIAIIVLVYLLEMFLSVQNNPLALVALGANVTPLVIDGQWGRLLTANFLHLGFLHVYLNVMALLIVGSITERILGWHKFLILFLCTCAAGALASSLFTEAFTSVGSSTGIFGLLGGLGYLNFKMGFRLPAGFQLGLRWWLMILGINFVLPFLLPQIDWMAHIGGFVTGVILTWYLTNGVFQEEQSLAVLLKGWMSNSMAIKLTAVTLVILYSLAFFLVPGYYSNRSQNLNVLVDKLNQTDVIAPRVANNIAWSIVIDENRSETLLSLADDIMQPAISLINNGISGFSDKRKSAYLDTFASVKYLQGNYQTAVESAQKALNYDYSEFKASQFSRFLSAWNMEQGIWLQGEVSLSDINLEADSESQIRLISRVDNTETPMGVIIQANIGAEGEERRVAYYTCYFKSENELIVNLLETSTLAIAAIDTAWIREGYEDRCFSSPVDGSRIIQQPGFMQSLFNL